MCQDQQTIPSYDYHTFMRRFQQAIMILLVSDVWIDTVPKVVELAGK